MLDTLSTAYNRIYLTTDSKSLRAGAPGDSTLAAIDLPLPAGLNAAQFGSNVAAEAVRATGVEVIALNPGARYRGLHDSLVNYLVNEQPQMLLCLQEESAILQNPITAGRRQQPLFLQRRAASGTRCPHAPSSG